MSRAPRRWQQQQQLVARQRRQRKPRARQGNDRGPSTTRSKKTTNTRKNYSMQYERGRNFQMVLFKTNLKYCASVLGIKEDGFPDSDL
jgi:hypothetical protein